MKSNPSTFAKVGLTAQQQKVEYLCSQRYPSYLSFKRLLDLKMLALKASGSDSPFEQIKLKRWQEQFKNEIAFEADLLAMPAAELDRAYEAAVEFRRQADEAEERGQFYNQPSAVADFSYWAKMPRWTIDEAIALSFGKDPKIVNWASLDVPGGRSMLHSEFAKIREVANRAVQCSQLHNPVVPSLYLLWSRDNEFPYPAELGEAVAKFGKKWPDWKSSYEQLKTQFDKYIATAETLLAKQKIDQEDLVRQSVRLTLDAAKKELEPELTSLRREREVLGQQVRELEARIQAQTQKWPWGDHETELLRKLAAAAERYWGENYDPADISTAPTNEAIEEWLKGQGVAARVAEIMATILRADGLRPGPR